MPHVTFIHGIANKPSEQKLRRVWLKALESDLHDNDDGVNLGTIGVSSSMIYWADVLYENPSDDDLFEGDEAFESTVEIAEQGKDPDINWVKNLEGEEKKMVETFMKRYSIDISEDESVVDKKEQAKILERVPLPWFVKKRLMKWLLKDVHHYLFNYTFSPRANVSYKVQDEIRERVLKKLNQVKKDKHILVAHSMGTVIIYDCLQRVENCPKIDGLITIGSPLGLDEIQDKFKPEWSRQNGFPKKLKGPWINIYDKLDPVAGFDPKISNDYKKNGQKSIKDINEQNYGNWRHDITNYLSMPQLRSSLLKTLNL